MSTISLRPDTLIDAASYGRNSTRYPLGVADAGGSSDDSGQVWIVERGPYGACALLVQGGSWESAWEAALDELPTVETGYDLASAYGYDTEQDFEEARDCAKRFSVDFAPELQTGYQYQSNASGTGVVDTSDLSMRGLRVRDLDDDLGYGVRLCILRTGTDWQRGDRRVRAPLS